MRKIVNGKVTKIDNIELFKMAKIGALENSAAVSNTAHRVPDDIDTKKLGRILGIYNAFYRALPYPLYAIEEKIKYATIASFIKHIYKQKCHIFINDGVYVVMDIDNMLALHMKGTTWSIEKIDCIIADNTSLDMYVESIGFEEYTWALENIVMNKKESYYNKFMKEFTEACNNDTTIMKWELDNILSFGSIPDRVNPKHNTIIDTIQLCEYSIDIYQDGYIKTANKKRQWSLNENSTSCHSEFEMIKKYGFSTMVKDYNKSNKLRKIESNILDQLFYSLCEEKSIYQMVDFPMYYGYIIGKTVVYQINNTIYTYNIGSREKANEIANSATIYSVSGNNLYISKSKYIKDCIEEVTIYSYNTSSGKIKTCKIAYSVDNWRK